MSNFFEQINAVYVINLDSRADRWDSFSERWKNIIPKEKLIRISAVIGTEVPGYKQQPWFTETTGERSRSWAGMAGCVLSHKKVIKDAEKKSLERILIMEDDAIPSSVFSENNCNSILSNFMDKQRDCGLFYLGCSETSPLGCIVDKDPESSIAIWKLSGVLATHAYIVQKQSFPTLLKCLPEEQNIWEWIAKYRAIDTWFRDYYAAESKLSVYAVLPRLILQGEFSSDVMPHNTNVTQFVEAAYARPKNLGKFFYPMFSFIASPFLFFKIRLNSIRTYRRAIKKGFPGLKKRKTRH